MILWKSREEPETRPKMPCTAFRWTFQVRGFKTEESVGFDVGLVHQHKLDGTWYDGHDEYLLLVPQVFEATLRDDACVVDELAKFVTLGSVSELQAERR